MSDLRRYATDLVRRIRNQGSERHKNQDQLQTMIEQEKKKRGEE